MDKAKQRFRFGSFKKIYVIIAFIGVIAIIAILGGYQFIAFIGVIIGAILGGYQVIQEILKAKEKQKEVKIHLSIGDTFSERLEYEMAIKEYAKALKLDMDNIKAHRRIITAATKKFELIRGLPASTTKTWGVATEEADNILAQIYRVHALNPSLKDDIGLLLEEAFLLKVSGRSEAGITVLEKAKKLFPNNPTVLAELGCLRALASSDKNIEGLDLLRRAIEIRPDEARYHYYLARAVEKAGLHAEAIRQYHQAVQLATGLDFWSQTIRQSALFGLIYVFGVYFPNCHWEREFTELDIPLEERIHILESIVAFRPEKGLHYSAYDPYLHLAILYYKAGDFEKAYHMIQEYLEIEGGIYRNHTDSILELYANILEKGGIDPDTLNKVRRVLKDRKRREEEKKFLNDLYAGEV